MKLAIVKKIYPYLNSNLKNIKWRSLTDEELNRAMTDKQMIANCYDEATRYALLASEKGRDLLKKRLKIECGASIDPAYKIKLNVNGKEKNYRVTKLDYYGQHFSLYKNYSDSPSGMSSFDYSNSPLSLGVNIAVRKMVRGFPSMKPLLSRLYMFPIIVNRGCEYNKPSNAFKWFTGKTPISYGEEVTSLSLKKHKDKVLDLLNDLGSKDSKDYSFVAVTGSKKVKDISNWHTLPIISVDSQKQIVEVMNKRTNIKTNIPFDDFVNKFKAIVGIKWN